jgi:thiamine-monophosphate kinase
VIGGDADPYWLGWLLVIINASDLAAAGAHPLGFLSALELEPEYHVEALRRLLLGTQKACQAEGLRYVGGNLKEAVRLCAVGTAIGRVSPGSGITRRGAQPGNILVSVGHGGVFWRDALAVLNGNSVRDKHGSPLFAPRSQIQVMCVLAEGRMVRAAIDNSDGLLPSLTQLAAANAIGITVDLAALSVDESEDLGVDPARLWLGWGDWNVLCAVHPEKFEEVLRVGEEVGVSITPIGSFHGETAGVFLHRHGTTLPAPRLESERFAADSWFSEGIQGYISRLLSVKIPE